MEECAHSNFLILFSLVASELLLQNTELTVAILDALSNLNLRSELLSEVSPSFLIFAMYYISATHIVL